MDVRVGLLGKLSAEEFMLLNCVVGNFTYDYSKMLLNDVLLSHIPPTKEVTYKEP